MVLIFNMPQSINKILYWFGYALSVITLCVGVMALLASLLLYEGNESWEIIIFWNIIGLICIFFPTLFFIRHKKKSPKEKSPFVQIEEQPSLNPKDKILSWLDYAWRIISLIIAIVFLLCAIVLFLIHENSCGLLYLIIGLVLVLPFVRKKSNVNLKSIIHSKRASLRAQLRMFDEEMLNDHDIVIENKTHTCLNCGSDYKGWFCPKCGQDRRKDYIDWHQLIFGMISDAINFDGSTIRTIYEMIRRPGFALHNYLEGRHERYSNPMKFVLFSGALYTILSIVLLHGSEPKQSLTIFDRLADNIMVYHCLMAFIVDFFPLYWTFKWTKEGKKYKQVDIYIIMLYLIGMDFWIRSLFCIPMHWFDVDKCNTIRWGLMFCYQFYVLKDFFKLRFWQIAGLYIPRYVIYFVFVIITLIPFMALESAGSEFSGDFPMTEKVAKTITGDFLTKFWHTVFTN